jgi:hypothetical protein
MMHQLKFSTAHVDRISSNGFEREAPSRAAAIEDEPVGTMSKAPEGSGIGGAGDADEEEEEEVLSTE